MSPRVASSDPFKHRSPCWEAAGSRGLSLYPCPTLNQEFNSGHLFEPVFKLQGKKKNLVNYFPQGYKLKESCQTYEYFPHALPHTIRSTCLNPSAGRDRGPWHRATHHAPGTHIAARGPHLPPIYFPNRILIEVRQPKPKWSFQR